MFKDLQNTLTAFFKKAGDPLEAITPEQLKAVLKSIEGKYNTLRDENRRLKSLVDEQQSEIAQLGLVQKDKALADLELDRHRGEAAELNLRIESLSADRKALQTQSDTFVRRIADLEPLVGQLKSLQDELALAEQARATALRLADADTEKAALRAQLAELQQELAVLGKGRTHDEGPDLDGTADTTELRTQLAEALATADQAKAEADRVRDELWDELWQTRQERDKIVADRDAVRSEFERLSAERDLLERQIAEMPVSGEVGEADGEQAVKNLSERLHAALESVRRAERERAEAIESLQIIEVKLLAATGQKTELSTQLELASGRILILESALVDVRAQLADPRSLATTDEASAEEVTSRLLATEPSSATEQEMLKAITALTEQVGRLSAGTVSPPLSRPAATASRSRPRQRKPPSTDDPARKLDWLMGV